MTIGDLVLNESGQIAILLTEPRLVDDDEYFSDYYVAEVYLMEFNEKELWQTDDLEILSEVQ
tara:strand:- start:443 stop:628 length:186 start_codon:yes stop_codon:yes gene_type:complete